MVTLTLGLAGNANDLELELADESLRPLIGELRIVSPLLAAKVEDAVVAGSGTLQLDEREVEFLATAARVVAKGDLVHDPTLDRLAQL
jgi:hypothetical protein